MRDLSTNEFTTVTAQGKVVLDFWADWCGPCKRVMPMVEELEKETGDVAFFKVNVDKEYTLAQEYNIKSIPTFVVLENGKEIHRISGDVGQLRTCLAE